MKNQEEIPALTQDDRNNLFGTAQDIVRYPNKIKYIFEIENALKSKSSKSLVFYLNIVKKAFSGVKTREDVENVKNRLCESTNDAYRTVGSIFNTALRVNK